MAKKKESTKSLIEIKITAKSLFIDSGFSPNEIAPMVKRSVKTINNWIRIGKWKLQKEARYGQAQELIRTYYEQLGIINQEAKDQKRPLNKGEADSIVKITAAIKNLETGISLHDYGQVMKEFSEFLRIENSLEIAKIVIEHQQAFLTKKANEL